MSARSFAEPHRLRVRRDDDGAAIIPGKYGHLWEFDDNTLALTLLDLTPKKWGNRRRACLGAGMEIHQDGEDEGTLLFDPADDDQLALAVKVCGIKRRRILSEAQLAVLAKARESSPLMYRRAPTP